jgi:hypothetical protein
MRCTEQPYDLTAPYLCLFSFHRKYTVLPERCHAVKVGFCLFGEVTKHLPGLPNALFASSLSLACSQKEGILSEARIVLFLLPDAPYQWEVHYG